MRKPAKNTREVVSSACSHHDFCKFMPFYASRHDLLFNSLASLIRLMLSHMTGQWTARELAFFIASVTELIVPVCPYSSLAFCILPTW
jgi:hypothetical protein